MGFRKLSDGTGTWIARLRDDEGRQRYRSLGQATSDFEYTKARHAAQEWFKNFDAGVSDVAPTVAEACREYVTDLEADGRERTAKAARERFEHTVYKHSIAKIPLDKLRARQLRDWRNGLGTTKASQNRTMNWMKAALNHAVANDRVNPSVAGQWKKVKAHRDADGRREIFLDLKQRRALIAACDGALKDLVEAAALTGARPGELVALKVADFDARTGTATFKGKSGSRTVPLSAPALELFKRAAKGKLPKALLLDRGDGKPWTHWYREVKAAVTEAKLPSGVVLYTLRHSWITEALTAGMSTLDVARLTGTSLPMIEKNYGHLVVDAARERLAQVEML